MRRAVLLYNPNAGRACDRIVTMRRIAESLQSADLEVRIVATEGPGTAGRQAADLCSATDILFACGGDGTIHEVLQGVAFQPQTALGIIPLGSANALARHLGLSLDPTEAALQQIRFEPRNIPLGRITYSTPAGEHSRYFVVMAGAGPDGELTYRMHTSGKHALGRLHYYLSAAWLFASARFTAFPVKVNGQSFQAVSAMSVRVSDLGGLFSPLVRGASIDHQHLTLSVARTPAMLSLPAWFALSWVHLHRFNRYASTFTTEAFYCGAGLSGPAQVQADGEHLGTTPMSVTLLPNALQLLMPSTP